MNTSIFGHIAVFITITIWSLTFVQTKILLNYLDPVEILLDRFVVAWIIFLIFSKKNTKINFKDEVYFILLGPTGIFGYYILENVALKYSSAINVGLIVTTAPVFTVILSMLRVRTLQKTIKIFLGFFICSQKLTHHIASISEKRFETKGDVIKSPSLPKGFFFM